MTTSESIKTAGSFVEEVAEIPGGEGVWSCIQCGTCSGSCPNANRMDYSPRKMLALIRANLKKEVLSSNSMWFCASCYLCTVRCPRGIKITDLMHILQSLSVRDGFSTSESRTPLMYRSFADFVYSLGRVPEVGLMTWYYLLSNPVRAVRMLPVALKLQRRGRMAIKAKRLKPEVAKQLQAILEKAETLGGAK